MTNAAYEPIERVAKSTGLLD
ncbi:hypothetical protein MPC4_990001 [Methylocella tundrae]|uniref:Uncharacterized protein n=1 Tax=Methylocella tundrae TaxID=227605 RepID=A0A8B6MCK1_METTU|nr:hypothetical protein MPC4_990001 [Methylocella tundrae]